MLVVLLASVWYWVSVLPGLSRSAVWTELIWIVKPGCRHMGLQKHMHMQQMTGLICVDPKSRNPPKSRQLSRPVTPRYTSYSGGTVSFWKSPGENSTKWHRQPPDRRNLTWVPVTSAQRSVCTWRKSSYKLDSRFHLGVVCFLSTRNCCLSAFCLTVSSHILPLFPAVIVSLQNQVQHSSHGIRNLKD